jgi:Flp pilus assembly protein TadG
MRSPRRHLRRQEDGAALAEFAIAAVVFSTAVFGVMEIGLALYSYHFISEAAWEGSRYARVRGYTCASNGVSCTANAAEIQAYVLGLALPGIDPAQLTVTPTFAGYPAGTDCTPSASCNNPGNLVTVTVSYSFPLTIPFVAPNTFTMTSAASAVISQ